MPKSFDLGIVFYYDANLIRDDRLEITYIYCCIVQTTIFNQLLPVTAHDALRWGVAVRVEDGRCRQQGNIGRVKITSIQNA